MWKYTAIEKNLKINDGAVLTALKSSLFSNVCIYECNWRSMATNSLISGLQYAWIRCKYKVWVFSPFLIVIFSATTPRKASEIHTTHTRKKILSSGERAWSYKIANFQLWEVFLSFWQHHQRKMCTYIEIDTCGCNIS